MNRYERAEARALIDYLLMNGCNISVHDGEEIPVSRSTRADDILNAMGTTEADTLRVRNAAGEMLARFWLIYGNGPGELIADHADTPFANAAWQHVQDTAVPMAYRA